ncbi:MAG: hypothetical protein ACLPLZ_12115 [Terracidiphilus sp.]
MANQNRSTMMESEQTMVVRALTCPQDNASFTEQDAARLCIHCHEPFLPKNCQITRCSNCGMEGKNGKLACECANGRLQGSGYRCPSCLSNGGEEMLAGLIACPYYFHALERPGPPPSKPPFPFRRLAEIAALCVVGAVAAAAAYKYGAPLVHRWSEPTKGPSPNSRSIDEPPGKQKPPPGHSAEPQVPGEVPESPPEQPGQQPGPGVVPAPAPVVTPAAIASFSASAQTIQRGSSTTLHWEVTGDNPTVSLLPGIGAVPPAGAWGVSPETTQQYTLTAINSGESSPQIRSIVIVVVPPPPVTIVSFTAEATHLQLGQATTLHWIVLGASQVRIDPGIGPVAATGSAIVRPLGNTIYILTASGPGGTKTGAVPISMAASSSAPATYPNEPQQPARLGPNQMPFSRYGRDSQAMQLLSAVQNAMGGKRNLGAIHGWQRTERVTWEINRGTTVETTTFAAPSDVRIESQGSNTTIDVSNGVAGWTWSSTRPIRNSLPASTAAGMPFRELPALLLSDDNPQRTVTLAGPSTLLITDKRNDRVFLKVDPSTHLPQAMMWMNLDGSELEENYSNWRQSAGIMWWRHMVRSRNHQEFLRADVTNFQVN